MKRSEAKWFGTLPGHWQVSTIGALYAVRNEKVSDRDYPPLSVTMKGVVPQLETAAKTDAHDDRKLVKKGDFAINSRSDRRGSCGISEYDGSVSLINTILTPRVKMNPHYYNLLFHTAEFADEFYKWGHGIVDDLWTTRWQEMKNICLPIPDLAEQETIYAFLSEKVAQIDALIANQEKQIEKLKQYKQALITEVVTKGLDPTVPMKDSGVEWIGKINASYFVQPLKYLLQEPMMYGASESGTKTNDYYRYIRITDIDNDGNLKHTEDDQYLDQIKGASYELQDGDLLFARSGGTVGKTFLYRSDYGRSAFAGYLIKGSCNKAKLLPEYLYYYTQSSLYALWKESIFVQSTIQNIGANRYSMLPVITPSISEQYTIVSFIKAQCHYIDLLIDKKLQKNEKLNQYKKSLIYDYVTGKKEVV